MKKLIFTLCVLSIAILSQAQDSNPLLSQPYIEVTGQAEMMLEPNEIYLQFTLAEKYDGRRKVELKDMEKRLAKELSSRDIDMADLRVSDAGADYVSIKRNKEDALSSKQYELRLTAASQLVPVLEALTEIDVNDAQVVKVDHTDMDTYKQEVKAQAMKNGKEQASTMLSAVGESLGNLLFVQDRQVYQPVYARAKGAYVMSEASDSSNDMAVEQIEFKKIKVSAEVFMRFQIK